MAKKPNTRIKTPGTVAKRDYEAQRKAVLERRIREEQEKQKGKT